MGALVKNLAVRDLLFSQVSSGNQTQFQQRVWKIVINSTSLQNAAALNNIAAQGDQANALGEGFADSLDVVGL